MFVMTGRKLEVPNPRSSSSKFLRPRQESTRKQDANTTISCLERSGFGSTTSRNLNSTVRRNLNVTMRRVGAGPPAFNTELESSIAYGEYLQAVMKKQISKRTTNEYKNILDNQLVMHSENLYTLQQNHKEILEKIEDINIQGEVVEILDYMSENLSNINTLFDECDTKKSVMSVFDTLREETNLLKLKNMKPIESQEEYDNFIQTVSDLAVILEKVLNSGRNFDGVTQLSGDIRRFNEVKKKVEELQEILIDSKNKVAVAIISNASDMFAKLGGYD